MTSAAWAVIHVQYDWYGMAVIFVTGIVFGIARKKSKSLLTTILMHSYMNMIATIETVVFLSLKNVR